MSITNEQYLSQIVDLTSVFQKNMHCRIVRNNLVAAVHKCLVICLIISFLLAFVFFLISYQVSCSVYFVFEAIIILFTICFIYIRSLLVRLPMESIIKTLDKSSNSHNLILNSFYLCQATDINKYSVYAIERGIRCLREKKCHEITIPKKRLNLSIVIVSNLLLILISFMFSNVQFKMPQDSNISSLSNSYKDTVNLNTGSHSSASNIVHKFTVESAEYYNTLSKSDIDDINYFNYSLNPYVPANKNLDSGVNGELSDATGARGRSKNVKGNLDCGRYNKPASINIANSLLNTADQLNLNKGDNGFSFRQNKTSGRDLSSLLMEHYNISNNDIFSKNNGIGDSLMKRDFSVPFSYKYPTQLTSSIINRIEVRDVGAFSIIIRNKKSFTSTFSLSVITEPVYVRSLTSNGMHRYVTNSTYPTSVYDVNNVLSAYAAEESSGNIPELLNNKEQVKYYFDLLRTSTTNLDIDDNE